MRSTTPFVLITLCALLASPRVARAQVEAPRSIEEVERDARQHKGGKAKAPPAEEPADDAEEDTADATPQKSGKRVKAPAAAEEDEATTTDDEEGTSDEPESSRKRRSRTDEDAAEAEPVRPRVKQLGPLYGPNPLPPGHSPDRPMPKPLLVTHATDEDLLNAWKRWKKSTAAMDFKDAQDAQTELLRLKDELGVSDLDSFAAGFIRVSQARAAANDGTGAVNYASVAVQLAPHLPYAHVALAQAYFAADPTELGRFFGAIKAALKEMASDPRYLRPALADLGTGALFALLATAAATLLALFLRKVRYFLHDFHHLFPKAAARWQSAAAAGLLLLLPVVLHLGLAPVLLVLFGAVTLYLGMSERIVAAALIASLGAVPVLGGLLAQLTGFAGTIAEDVYRLERGGLGATEAMQHTQKRLADGRAEFPELFALARYELRRGQLDAAIDHFKLAATKRNNEARLLTNLGNALLEKGDSDGALEMYQNASQADPTLAAAFFNLSKLYSRRAAALPDEAVGVELDKAHNAIANAQRLDESLLSREDPPPTADVLANRLLLSPSLSASELSLLASSSGADQKVQAQLSRALLGTNPSMAAFVYPAALAGLLFGFGLLSLRLRTARACEKCGRSVCRRCDPEIGVGSTLCGQCVNVFARKGVVPAPLKVRKQLEVAHHQTRMGRLSYLLGLLCSGAGHLFAGLPVRGAIYAFLFSFTVFEAFFRHGVMPVPYGPVPLLWRLAPAAVVFLAVYLLSLRGLYKRQTG